MALCENKNKNKKKNFLLLLRLAWRRVVRGPCEDLAVNLFLPSIELLGGFKPLTNSAE